MYCHLQYYLYLLWAYHNWCYSCSDSWKNKNCQILADEYKAESNEIAKESKKKERNKCNRDKAMYGLEYSSLIFDVFFGFVCTILGLLHYFDIAKYFEIVTGIIGLVTGIIGFVLTLVYVIYSGYIFTKDPYDNGSGASSYIYKRNGDWAFAKLEEGKGYKCLYYKKGNTNSAIAKQSDVGKKQYNYNKKKNQEETDSDSDYFKCKYSDELGPKVCATNEYFPSTSVTLNTCKALYAKYEGDTIDRKYLFDKWVTTIIFSCFIIACDIGLAIFGYLLFKSDGSGI